MNNRNLLILIGIFLVVRSAFGQVPGNNIPRKYKVRNDYFLISTRTPPGFIFIEDSQGRRTGINPTFKSQIDQFGILENRNGFIAQIPISSAEQQAVGDPNNNFAPAQKNPTLIQVLDGGTQTYTINLVGITQGLQRLTVKDLPVGQPVDPYGIHIFALIQPNTTRKINVSVNSNDHSVTYTRLVQPGDILKDVNATCQLGLISPGGTCQDLQKKANSILKDSQSKDLNSETQHIQVFLSALQSVDKNHVQDPAFTILQEEAQALLNVLNNQ